MGNGEAEKGTGTNRTLLQVRDWMNPILFRLRVNSPGSRLLNRVTPQTHEPGWMTNVSPPVGGVPGVGSSISPAGVRPTKKLSLETTGSNAGNRGCGIAPGQPSPG